MLMNRRTLLQAGAAGFAVSPFAQARGQSANTIKIGLLTDLSGTYRDVNGPASLACTRLAAQEFGNQGFNVEVVSADHQNRPDVGSTVVRQWIDRDGIDVVVDVPTSSVALAVLSSKGE
jgi:branched-chain amino acid transport system substrate-binding protein